MTEELPQNRPSSLKRDPEMVHRGTRQSGASPSTEHTESSKRIIWSFVLHTSGRRNRAPKKKKKEEEKKRSLANECLAPSKMAGRPPVLKSAITAEDTTIGKDK